MIKRCLIFPVLLCCTLYGFAQQNPFMTAVKINPATSIKNQARTGTCWSFSTTSLVESENMRKSVGDFNISEMYTVREMYIEKAKNYLLRQGKAQFGQGGLGHDVIRAIAKYGAVPESAYTGLVNGEKSYNHSALFKSLHAYLDTLLKKNPLPDNWLTGYEAILDQYMGKAPSTFSFDGKTYTPKQFADEVMHFDPNDYVGLTSFTHHPFNTSFVIEIPDNYANGYYYNIPLDSMINIVEHAVQNGYTVMWDADVSNNGWKPDAGYAMVPEEGSEKVKIRPDMEEKMITQEYRQKLFDELVTEDDHLMHIIGLEKGKNGKLFFLVKNSWGEKSGPFGGYVYVSVPYFALNTITIILPKKALDPSLAQNIANAYPAFYQ